MDLGKRCFVDDRLDIVIELHEERGRGTEDVARLQRTYGYVPQTRLCDSAAKK